MTRRVVSGAKVHALVAAAGKGRRFGGAVPKQYCPIGDGKDARCVLQYSLTALMQVDDILDSCTIVVAADDRRIDDLALPANIKKAIGGADRWQSVANGVRCIAKTANANDLVLIHDAARPCLQAVDARRVVACAHGEKNGAILGVKATDTLKTVAGGYIVETPDRNAIWCAQTPQVFRLDKLMYALDFVERSGASITDEAMAFEILSLPIKIVEGRSSNIKITTASDLSLARAFLQARLDDAKNALP